MPTSRGPATRDRIVYKAFLLPRQASADHPTVPSRRSPLLRSNSSVRKALPGGLPGRGDAEFSKWEAGVFETVSRVEQDREHMEDKLQELRRALPR